MKLNNLNDKLIRIERTINIYNENNELIKEINIDIPIKKLKNIVLPKEDDPLLYDGYVLSREQLENINSHIKDKILPNFESNSYVLECTGIYNW